MEEQGNGDHQDDLEKMLPQMRAEALKREKDWLRTKIAENVTDGNAGQQAREENNGKAGQCHIWPRKKNCTPEDIRLDLELFRR
ncbi:hypothetical protein NDU88_002311 [Pleurodeles waltl]|uniref:Uncharacterized protein n=1 Tax=Pleurodeles waltl TaxID=8319 RepID=A0AAV7LC61_PLEWA|nr:hypothetical protein NDU88_002311 [Pleurodeles waltl]